MKNDKKITKPNRDYIDFSQMDLVNIVVAKQRRKRTIDYTKKIMKDEFLFQV